MYEREEKRGNERERRNIRCKKCVTEKGEEKYTKKKQTWKEASTFRYARVEAQKLENGKTKERKCRHVKLAQ